MRRRLRLSGRGQQDILGEVIRLGQVAFDALHKIERIRGGNKS